MAYKFQLGAATLSGSLVQEGDLYVSSSVAAEGNRNLYVQGSLSIGGTEVTATAAELNYLDNSNLTAADITKLAAIDASATELNYLDLTNAIGTVGASEAVVVDSDKDVSGFRNVGAAQLTTSGKVIVDDTTEATSTTDGSLQTDGGLSVAKSVVIGDDLDLLSNSAIFKVGTSEEFTLTHANADHTLLASSGHRLAFGAVGEYVSGNGTDLLLVSGDDVKVTGDLVPSADDTYDLGTTALAWQDLHLEGDVLMTDAGKVETAAGDLTLSSAAAGVTIDAATTVKIDSAAGDISFADNGTAQLALDLDGTAGEVIMQLKVDSDDFVFKQYDGTEVFRVEDDGAFDIAGGAGSSGVTVSAAGQITADGRVIIDDATEATSTTDGSLQTDGGLSVAKSAVIGDDLDLLSNSAIFKVGSDQPFTLTHANANNTLLASTNHRLAFGDAGEYIYGDGTDLKIVSSGDVDITGDVDVVGTMSCDTSFTIDTTTISAAEIGVIDNVTAGTVAASKAVVADANKDFSGFRHVSGSGNGKFLSVYAADLTQGRIVTAGSSGQLEDQAALNYYDDRADGYLELSVSSSASGSAELGDGMLSVHSDMDESLIFVSKYTASTESGFLLDQACAPVAAIASGDNLLFLDANDNKRGKLESIDDIAALFAGTGLAAASAVISIDLNELSGADVAIANDSIAIIDATDNSTKKESLVDVVAAMAGDGLTATNGVLAVSGAGDSMTVASIGDANATLAAGMNAGSTTLTAARTWTLPASPTNGDVVYAKAPGNLGGFKVKVKCNDSTSHTLDSGLGEVEIESANGVVSMVYIGGNTWSIF